MSHRLDFEEVRFAAGLHAHRRADVHELEALLDRHLLTGADYDEAPLALGRARRELHEERENLVELRSSVTRHRDEPRLELPQHSADVRRVRDRELELLP